MPKVRLNWLVFIVCKDCHAQFEIQSVDPTTEVLEDGARGLLCWVPNACPTCRNIRLLPTKEEDEQRS